MSTLQVRNLPDDLHRRLSERAESLNLSMSAYVTNVLRDDLSRPLVSDWIATVDITQTPREIDVVAALDSARNDYEQR